MFLSFINCINLFIFYGSHVNIDSSVNLFSFDSWYAAVSRCPVSRVFRSPIQGKSVYWYFGFNFGWYLEYNRPARETQFDRFVCTRGAFNPCELYFILPVYLGCRMADDASNVGARTHMHPIRDAYKHLCALHWHCLAASSLLLFLIQRRRDENWNNLFSHAYTIHIVVDWFHRWIHFGWVPKGFHWYSNGMTSMPMCLNLYTNRFH